ncbi:MAG: hypothetical protein QI223_10825 [Candidatus Korarchaeota archaeon]|nr:hypothetical protein [Candidatus Korarchaeota archaeon]
MALGLREMWLEFRSELEGMGQVLLAGALGPALILALVAVTDPLVLLLTPLPLFLASVHASASDRSGPAIALGALLGLALVSAFALSPLYPPFYRWVHRGVPAPSVENIPLPCRACSPFLTTLLIMFVEFLIAAPSLTLFSIIWVTMSVYPACVARSRFRSVPKLLLIMYLLALLANSASCTCCFPLWLVEWPQLYSALAHLDPALSSLLAAACLWKAWRGGGGNLLSFLSFYAVVGASMWWWWLL